MSGNFFQGFLKGTGGGGGSAAAGEVARINPNEDGYVIPIVDGVSDGTAFHWDPSAVQANHSIHSGEAPPTWITFDNEDPSLIVLSQGTYQLRSDLELTLAGGNEADSVSARFSGVVYKDLQLGGRTSIANAAAVAPVVLGTVSIPEAGATITINADYNGTGDPLAGNGSFSFNSLFITKLA